MVSTLDGAGRRARRSTSTTDFTITGRLARFGRGGMIQDVSNRLLRDFASCLQAHLQEEQAAAVAPAEEAAPPPAPAPRAAPQQAKPVNALRLLLGVILDRLKRLFGRR